MRAVWTASGACTNGSTAHPRGATRRASGGAATTSTTGAERTRGARPATTLRRRAPLRDRDHERRVFARCFDSHEVAAGRHRGAVHHHVRLTLLTGVLPCGLEPARYCSSVTFSIQSTT